MTLGSHQKTVGKSQTWITPKWIIDAIGPFDTDPCAAKFQPWPCAKLSYALPQHDGLKNNWCGRVWLNPPFSRYQVSKWVAKLAAHGSGTALLHARTEAEWFEPVWKSATAILFLAERLHFYYQNGERAKANSGAPACLVAFSEFDAMRLRTSGFAGYFVTQWQHQ
jgi:DNA N-6-adenine-methyltransferase (Dam)